MRFLVQVNIPVETGNRAVQDGTLGTTIQRILGEQKPEAAYFVAENGQRCGYLILNIDNASKIPSIAEPWFLAFNARVEIKPAMIPDDLQKASQDIAASVKNYAQEYTAV